MPLDEILKKLWPKLTKEQKEKLIKLIKEKKGER
jgi:hypothetical protein